MSEIHIITEQIRTKVTQATEYRWQLPDGTTTSPMFPELMSFEALLEVRTEMARQYPGLKLLTRAVFRSEWIEVPA